MTGHVVMTLRLPAEDHEQLRRISFERRTPINEIVRHDAVVSAFTASEHGSGDPS